MTDATLAPEGNELPLLLVVIDENSLPMFLTLFIFFNSIVLFKF